VGPILATDRLETTAPYPGPEPMAGSQPRDDGPSAWDGLARRGMDVVGAALLLLITAPLSLVAAVWIRVDSPGPALLRQQRIGLGRRPFTLYKFRTMRVGADDAAHRALIAAELRGEDTRSGGSTKLDGDPRITRAGRFLRKTSCDELPQLWNVLRGDMSLVGPRPCLPWEADMFPARYAERFTVRPGLTGLWQVRGRSSLGTREMLELDLEYVRTRRLGTDLWIVTATLPALLRGDGAR
jgi:lipopolysaccharide/colanic/teichoic acid biosynthesis glycosyltransferase